MRLKQTLSSSRALTVAAALFFSGSATLVAVSFGYAANTPGSTALIDQSTRAIGSWRQLDAALAAHVEAAINGDQDAVGRHGRDRQRLEATLSQTRQLIRSNRTARAFMDAQSSALGLVRLQVGALAELQRHDRQAAQRIVAGEDYRHERRQVDARLATFLTEIHALRRGRISAFAMLATTVAVLAAGAILWWIGWRGARLNEAAMEALRARTEALALADARYRAAIDEAVVGLVRVDAAGTITAANPALARMLGYENAGALLQRHVGELYVDPAERVRVLAEIGDRTAASGLQLQWRRLDGQQISVRLTTRVVRHADGTLQEFDDIVEDVTERVELGEQLRHSQKMEAVGRLAGGVAHDFNNLLTVIGGNAEFLLEETAISPAGAACLAQIVQATTSAGAVTRQLLAFSRKSPLRPQALYVNEAVSYANGLITRLIGEDIRVRCDLNPRCGRVFVDRDQLEQALINLALNARDAMPHGGTLTFKTDVSADGARLCITVQDTGHGIDAATQQRIFEPFFTTKEAGKGTGLGLSMVYGFVQQAGGEIRVASIVGRGTAMALEFPVTAEDVVSAPATPAAPAHRTGSERILLVEDQEALRTLIAKTLRTRGFAVLEAANAAEARRIVSREASVDLVLADMVLPGESGSAFAAWLQEVLPNVAATLMSGYSNHPVTGAPAPGVLLQKPFTPAQLLDHVRAALDRHQETGYARHAAN